MRPNNNTLHCCSWEAHHRARPALTTPMGSCDESPGTVGDVLHLHPHTQGKTHPTIPPKPASWGEPTPRLWQSQDICLHRAGGFPGCFYGGKCGKSYLPHSSWQVLARPTKQPEPSGGRQAAPCPRPVCDPAPAYPSRSSTFIILFANCTPPITGWGFVEKLVAPTEGPPGSIQHVFFSNDFRLVPRA